MSLLRVPVGHDAERWRTFQGTRTLVVAARTVTSAVRVLEVLPALLRGDGRVTVVVAHDPTSAFGDGVSELLRAEGCRVMPWEQLDGLAPDLVLSASENIDLPEGDCPVLVLPHGVGFQKRVPDSRSARTRLSGVVPDSLLATGRAWLAVSHPDQEEQLLASHPLAAGRTLLVGDPCYDRLRAGLARRAAYRRALRVADDQRLVVVSSTWGPTSLLGRDPQLPARLLAELPLDEYRVAAITHPNVWSGHGSWQIRTLQAAALEAGLLLIPPERGWQPTLVAADAVVGDHGSVTLYGAALGKPVLLATVGSDSEPGTAMAELSRTAPRLAGGEPLRAQLDRAVREHTPGRYAGITDRAFAEPDQALARLRTALYGLLRLPEPGPAAAPALAYPPPEQRSAPVTSALVHTAVDRVAGQWSVTVRRHPAAVAGEPGVEGPLAEGAGAYVHLACDEEEPDQRLTGSASVLLRRRPAGTAVAGVRWVRETLESFPGSLLAAVPVDGGCLAGLRDGRIVEAAATGPAADPGLSAAVVYACLRAALPLDDTVVTLRVGGRRQDVALRVRPSL
ncbi:hypothetical protein ACIQGZ_15570 [Streptomyces sp. NPDC092296]|uniref:hypothetical protein n=1 Tax=Streptomyces sp. NPDC092296 TaxID=3366012 RepID=UPI00382E1EE1